MAAVPDVVDLVCRDNPADDRSRPVIIRANQSSCPIVQFQYRISQCIGNAKLSKLGANGTNNHLFWLGPLNHESSDHHVVIGLHKGTGTDVPEKRITVGAKIVHFHESNSGGVVYATQDRGVVARWQVCDDRRFPPIAGYVAAAANLRDLAAGDNPTDDRPYPIVIRGNQRSGAVM